MGARRILGCTVLFAALALPAAAEPLVCADASLSVEGGAPAAAELACRDAAEAKSVIEACGLVQTRPIRIELVAALDHGFGLCLGAWDCEAGVIRGGSEGTTVEVKLADGTQRIIFFNPDGSFLSFSTAEADGTAAMAISSERKGDVTIAKIGSETSDIPDVLLTGD